MKIAKLVALFFLSSIQLVFCQTNNEVAVTADSVAWKTHTDSMYAVQYPEHWEFNASGMSGSTFLIFSPLTSAEDLFRDNVNLMIQDLTGHNLSLDLYIELSVNQIDNYITDAKFLLNERKTAQGLDFRKLIYTGRQGKFKLTFEQYIWVVDDKAYILSLTCEQDQYETYQAIGEQILDRFVLVRKK